MGKITENSLVKSLLKHEAKSLDEFISHSTKARKIISKINPEEKFYLTVCRLCCSEDTSYRFFVGVPEFNIDGHADSFNEGLVTKIYNQPSNLIMGLGQQISSKKEGDFIKNYLENVPDKAACYQVL